MTKILQFDFEKFAALSRPGPRYTSYPTAIEFSQNYTYAQYLADLKADSSPLSLYLHLPFCRSACYFCGCNVIYTSKEEGKSEYIELLARELEILKDKTDCTRPIYQLHFGGGTPTFFSAKELEKIISLLKNTFTNFAQNAEISCEIDPRFFNEDQAQALENGGFNRFSFGVQDFQSEVQNAIHRIQPLEIVQNAVNLARKHGIKSINFDLIYGLPHQNLETFSKTLKTCLSLSPDRFAIFNYAHVPWMKKTMRKIDETTLPSPKEKLEILKTNIEILSEAGYEMIGMDHFAKPNDELFLALKDGSLRRNFQGYSTKGGTSTLGLGLTSIGEGRDFYAQNHKDFQSYKNAILEGNLPFCKGIKLNTDDLIRKRVIMRLMSVFKLDFAEIEREFEIDFLKYFKKEIALLREYEKENLLEISNSKIEIKLTGVLLVRNIAMCFDAYLLDKIGKQIFSKTI